MKYTLFYTNPQTQFIPIEATFDVKNEKEVELQFPVWRPGRYERTDFAKNIHGFHVLNDAGKKIEFEKTSKDTWKIACDDTKSIKVCYKYYAAELNAGSTFMDDTQLYVNPVNCLVYLKDQINESCELTLEIPDNFEIACGQTFEEKKAVFTNYHQLVDSPFIASASMEHYKFECKGVLFHLWFQGKVNIDDKVIVDIEQYTSSQIEKFDQFPVDEYHYLYQILPIKAYHGVEHQTSTVIALGPTYDLMGSLYDDFLGVSSHELYHTWNVKALRPIEMFPYDYSTENYSKLGYVAEGVTTYMGDLFLAESGVKDWDWYKVEVEKLMQTHFDNFGRFNYSVGESSFDTWLDGYVKGIPNRKVSIYNEGALLAMILDAKIRTVSNNKASMHDVMKSLYENFALQGKGYSEEDYKKTLEEFAQEDLTSFFDKFYNGTDSYESILTEALLLFGLQIKLHHNKSYAARILGAITSKEHNKTIVKRIYPGGSADLAGVMHEDEIVAVNGFKVDNDLDKWVEFFQDDQLELTVSRMGRIVQLTAPHTNKSYFPIYKLEPAKAPSNLQKRIFKKWCGTDWDEI
ncbi:hypothetical protein K6119_00975 [Paracrocinitomix mangrovi]|uniref:M61 family metallopeptidase n=1 Tax=Paracrocinitomix mangrovi TaxID=2862509 RepID=UPI001C8D580E|nr:hypothetical protein [Paracrocinitomix mangrovi]UKN02087.1 hypothetical protein K6119_00975 [Paracrocinitomix mangrovi]